MSEQENLRTVQGIFEAFGRGDIPGLLDMVTDDVQWIVSGPDTVPYFGERRGRAGVTDFFVQLGSNVEFQRFEPQEFVAQGDKVAVTGSERGLVKTTGRSFDNDWAMLFTVGGGKVSRLRIYENSAAIAEAFRP